MCRQTITREGLAYRTKLMSDQAKAISFAKCLSGNSRFTDVLVVESSRSAGKFFITFRPSSMERQGDMLDWEQAARDGRAQDEGFEYIFWQDDSELFWWCLSTSGEVYEVTSMGCSCPDHIYRCRYAGISCKHVQAFDLQGQAGRLKTRRELAAAA